MATDVPMTFVRTRWALVPADAQAAELHATMNEGDEIALVERGESTPMQRRVFAILGQVAKLDNAFLGPEDVLCALKAVLGYGSRFTTPDGMEVFRERPLPKRPKQFNEFWRDATEAMIRLEWMTADEAREILDARPA